jgi:predicted amidohydrolase
VARIVCEQIAPVIADIAGNMFLIAAAVRRALDARADIIVLPELATSGYVFDSAQEAHNAAITVDDAFFGLVAHLLHGTDSVVVFGFCELAPGGALYNSAAVVTEDGLRCVYRKTHLWDRETLVFTPGQGAPPVVTTAHGRIGVLICYDLEFPEMPRALAMAGADVLVVPTNWPRGEHPPGERYVEIILAQAAARANGVFVAVCDRRGVERGQAWNEGSVIIDQFGWVRSAAAASHAPHLAATADIFPALARDKAISPHNNLLADRRTDIYAIEVPAP